MKHIPESFELTQEEIEEACYMFLNNRLPNDKKIGALKFSFKMERVNQAPPPGATIGGMSDYSVEKLSVKITNE